MSFTIQKTLTSYSSYPSIGLIDPLSEALKTVDVTYSVIRLDSLIGNSARVVYTSCIGDSPKRFDFFDFEFSGSGDIVSEAELKLENHLKNM